MGCDIAFRYLPLSYLRLERAMFLLGFTVWCHLANYVTRKERNWLVVKDPGGTEYTSWGSRAAFLAAIGRLRQPQAPVERGLGAGVDGVPGAASGSV